jgi:hypothetical protein
VAARRARQRNPEHNLRSKQAVIKQQSGVKPDQHNVHVVNLGGGEDLLTNRQTSSR